MNAPTLAEIIEEGRRLQGMERDAANFSALFDARVLLREYYAEHGPALFAVAEDAGRFCEPAEEWLKLRDTPDKVSGAAWTRVNEAREKLLAHFAAAPTEPEP